MQCSYVIVSKHMLQHTQASPSTITPALISLGHSLNMQQKLSVCSIVAMCDFCQLSNIYLTNTQEIALLILWAHAKYFPCWDFAFNVLEISISKNYICKFCNTLFIFMFYFQSLLYQLIVCVILSVYSCQSAVEQFILIA